MPYRQPNYPRQSSRGIKMESSSIIILETNFLLIALLPFVFFRSDGKFTLLWCLTATPFCLALIAFAYLFLHKTSLLLAIESSGYQFSQSAGIVLSCISISLIALTVGTHRIPVALWHQNSENDRPVEIVTWGSYKYIRHPFYTSFILAWLAGIAIVPHWIILALALYSGLMLLYTAKKEEHRLSSQEGPLGSEYKAYLQRTGRFFPRIVGHSDASWK